MAALEAAELQDSDDDVLKDAAESFIEGDEIEDDLLLSALGFESERDLIISCHLTLRIFTSPRWCRFLSLNNGESIGRTRKLLLLFIESVAL